MSAVTSFNAFPARNLERFLLCEVFFFGTARSIDSHNPVNIEGTLKRVAEGSSIAVGVIDWVSLCNCCEARNEVTAINEYNIAEEKGGGSCRIAVIVELLGGVILPESRQVQIYSPSRISYL